MFLAAWELILVLKITIKKKNPTQKSAVVCLVSLYNSIKSNESLMKEEESAFSLENKTESN